jgi:methionyl-tRNA formyltransferase
MRIVLFGSPLFAVPTLERLLASSHEVVGVVTQPDKPRGRGHHVGEGPVKAVARGHGLPVLQPERLKTPAFLDEFRALAPDLGVVAAYGKILPDEVLQIPRAGLINVHASLLPRWRGAAPIEYAVMAGDTETGVTIMRVVRQLDAGAMFAAVSRPIGGDETAEQIEADLGRLGAGLLVEVVDQIADRRATETPQDERLVTCAPRLTKEAGAIDWSRPAATLHNQVRGLHPWPHAYAYLDGARYIVLRTAVEPAGETAGPPGSVVEAAGDRFVAATGDGALRLLELQPEGRRGMSAREFLAGRRVQAGARFDRA